KRNASPLQGLSLEVIELLHAFHRVFQLALHAKLCAFTYVIAPCGLKHFPDIVYRTGQIDIELYTVIEFARKSREYFKTIWRFIGVDANLEYAAAPQLSFHHIHHRQFQLGISALHRRECTENCGLTKT